LVSNELYFPNPIRKQVYSTAKFCPCLSRALFLHFLLLLGIGSLAFTGVASAAGQDTDSTSVKEVAGQETQQETVVDQAATVPATTTDPQTASDSLAAAESPDESTAEYWHERVNALREKIEKGIKAPDDADVLYEELSQQLRLKRKALRNALRWAKSPTDAVDPSALPDNAGEQGGQPVTVEDIYHSMVNLYQTRILLLQSVSLELKAQITGHDEAGQVKLKGEVEYMLLYLRFHTMAIPQLGPHLLDKLIATPVLVTWDFLKLILAIILFRWWRQWAPQGLVDLRGRIIRIRPRTQHSLRFARLIWYLQEIRSPLEWMLLLWLFIEVVATPSLLVIEDFLHIIFNALLFAWLAVRLINAIASRGVAGLADDSSGLRLRSLRLIAGWILVLSLGLKLTETYTGEGTIYAMVWTLFEVLSVPVVVLLLSWWRLEIRQSLEQLPALPGWVEKTTENRSGLRKYLNTLLGGLYLIYILLRQLGIRQLSRFAGGRELVVKLIGRELYKEQERKALALDTRPVSSEISDKLLGDEANIVEKVFARELKRLTEFVEFGDGGLVSIRGERGIGRSLLLDRLAQAFEEKCIIVKCDMRGFEGIVEGFAEKFSIPKDQLSAERLRDLVMEHDIRFIAFDGVHLLARPKMNGIIELDRLSDWVAPLRSTGKIILIVTMIRSAFQYLIRLRGESAVLADSIELPAWTLEQITELIEIRSRQAGIEPDFSEIEIPYQYEVIDFDSVDDRVRSWFYRILWNMSAGNPSVALRLWNDSLAETPEGRVVVQVLPQVFAVDQMENVSLPILLTLRVIVQSGMTTAEDIAESLQLPSNVIENGIRYSLHCGWIEDIDGYYQVTWRWFRTIKRVLTRQNLLAL
jgi:hypothetical protein